eukprot:SAG31_NODE_17258_length_677_cov_1.833910_1_plen_70_part_10
MLCMDVSGCCIDFLAGAAQVEKLWGEHKGAPKGALLRRQVFCSQIRKFGRAARPKVVAKQPTYNNNNNNN